MGDSGGAEKAADRGVVAAQLVVACNACLGGEVNIVATESFTCDINLTASQLEKLAEVMEKPAPNLTFDGDIYQEIRKGEELLKVYAGRFKA